jgi:iron complex transport system substrate-binding protein
VYNNDRRTVENGGNDYFESGYLYADRVLADLIAIFHPELMPDHELYYYRRLE